MTLCRSAALTLGFLLVGQAAAGDGVLRKVGADELARLEARREAGVRPETPRLSRLAAGLNTPGFDFLLPIYQVDVDGALTTLFAARNAFEVPNQVVVSYFDVFGDPITSEVFDLAPLGLVTRNLRDVAGLPADPDGVRRGFAILEGSSELTGDFFRVDPASNFASGDRLVRLDEALCEIWDFRFLREGAFSGGTDMVLFVDNPLGRDLAGTPSAILVAYDEAGNELGSVGLWTGEMVNRITADEVLDELEVGTNSGVFDIFFDALTNGGLVFGTYSAEDRYSIGMHGTCY